MSVTSVSPMENIKVWLSLSPSRRCLSAVMIRTRGSHTCLELYIGATEARSLGLSNMDLNYILVFYLFISLIALGSCKPRRKIKNNKFITMSKPTKGFLNDWKPKKPRSTKSSALVSCSTSSSSSSCVFPFKYMNRYSTVQYRTLQYSTVHYNTVH